MSSSQPHPSTVPQHRDTESVSLSGIARRVVDQWRTNRQPDTQAALVEHPELRQHVSLVIDLAYEEYCQRADRGEIIERRQFCERFPTIQASLERLIDDHDWLVNHAASLLNKSQPEPIWPAAGEQVVDFDLIHLLGRGAVARTFVARQRSLGDRLVALKMTPSESGEASTLARLQHTGIVPIHSIEYDPMRMLSLLVMPYHGGATLEHVVSPLRNLGPGSLNGALLLKTIAEVNRPLPVVEPPPVVDPTLAHENATTVVIRLLEQLAEALRHTHARGVVHRDLKPSNVLLTPAGRPLLLDFHLADDLRRDGSTVGGTLAYMSPEQLKEMRSGVRDRQIDGRADIYSLGVLLVQLLTGSLPFQLPRAESFTKTIDLHLVARATPWTRAMLIQRSIQPDLATLITRCMSVDPAERPVSSDAFLQELRACHGGKFKLGRREWLWGAAGLTAAGAVAWTLTPRGETKVSQVFVPLPGDDQLTLFQSEMRSGRRCLENKEYQAAIAHFEAAAPHKQGSGLPSIGLGKANLGLRRYDEALYHFLIARKRQSSAVANVGVAEVYSLQDRSREAITAWQQIRNTVDQSPAVLNNLAHALTKGHKNAEARMLFNDLIAQHPELQSPYVNRLFMEFTPIVMDANYDPTFALADAEAAIRIGPPCASVYDVYGRLLVHAARQDPKRLDDAIEAYRKAISLGYPPEAIGERVHNSALFKHPKFEELLATPRPKVLRIEMVNPPYIMPLALDYAWPPEAADTEP
jgi:hypothetical protein